MDDNFKNNVAKAIEKYSPIILNFTSFWNDKWPNIINKIIIVTLFYQLGYYILFLLFENKIVPLVEFLQLG